MTEKYCEKYDAIYNEEEDKWVENKCTDPKCIFCKNRPEKPSKLNNKDLE